MVIKVRIILLYCFLVTVTGCATKSEVTQQSSSPQQAASPQQTAPTPAPSGTASNVAKEPKQQQNVNAGTGAAAAQTDACALITKSEIEAVQGEPVKDTKSSDRSTDSLAISQCFYSLATFHKSVSLEVTRANPANANKSGAKEFWNQTFHKKAGKEEREEEEEEEKEKSKPEPVPGVGDEAFWSGNRTSGALYVLKNNAIIRISIGGPDKESVKINKSKVLAQKALGRL
jgi:hypothetical protein